MKDNFSKQAKLYSVYRPVYPQQLYDYLLNNLSSLENAWDCGTGNGQVAKELAKHFEKVYATDISKNQLDHAEKKDNIYYSGSPAEKTIFENNFFDLITVAQALHWFDFDDFYKEVKRVARDNAILAVWGYSLSQVTEEIDRIILKHYNGTLGQHWDIERKHVDQEYENISFPFTDIKKEKFVMEHNWTIKDMEGYLNTWSAVQHFMQHNYYNPVPDIIQEIEPYWAKDEVKKVTFPIFFRSGKIK